MYLSNGSPKAIAIFVTSLRIGDEPISNEYYWECYQDLMLSLKARGIEAYLTSGNDTYLGDGIFSRALMIEHKVNDPRFLTPVRNVHVNFVLERSEGDAFRGTDIMVLNDDNIRGIINNKISLYDHFDIFQPYSKVVEHPRDLPQAVRRMPGRKVVVKIADGFGGEGVYIGSKTEVIEQSLSAKFPVLVQEFLDTSMGIPGGEPGVHDLRCIVAEGKIIGLAIRRAKPGSYHSNVHQGATLTTLPLSEVPDKLVQIIRAIDTMLPQVPRFYSADFVYSERGWKLIELNDYVGLTPIKDGPESSQFLEELTDYLEMCHDRITSPLGDSL